MACTTCNDEALKALDNKIQQVKGYAKTWAAANNYKGFVAIVRLINGSISHRPAAQRNGAELIELVPFD